MPTVKITAGTASVEIEATEASAKELAELALGTLRSAHQIDVEHTKMAPVGFERG
jgi:hypothetical protein